MSGLLRDGAGLSERAVRFLRANATEFDCRWDAAEDRREAEEVAGHYGLAVDKVVARLAALRERFGGLRYESRSWSFEEVIMFVPALDFDEEDTEPRVTLIEHTVAHPYGVWATLDGAVDYMFPGELGGDYVRVFDRPSASSRRTPCTGSARAGPRLPLGVWSRPTRSRHGRARCP
jgi:hypothetical protein